MTRYRASAFAGTYQINVWSISLLWLWLNVIIHNWWNHNFDYSGDNWSLRLGLVLFSFTAQFVHVSHCPIDSYYFKEGNHGSDP